MIFKKYNKCPHRGNFNEDRHVSSSSEDVATAACTLGHNLIIAALRGFLATFSTAFLLLINIVASVPFGPLCSTVCLLL